MSGNRDESDPVVDIATAAAAGGGPAAEALAEGADVDDRPALDVDPGDAGPVQEDDDLPAPDEHQGQNDDDE